MRGTSDSGLCLFPARNPVPLRQLLTLLCEPPEGEDRVKPMASKPAYLPVLKNTGRVEYRNDDGDDDDCDDDDDRSYP